MDSSSILFLRSLLAYDEDEEEDDEDDEDEEE